MLASIKFRAHTTPSRPARYVFNTASASILPIHRVGGDLPLSTDAHAGKEKLK